MSEEEFFNKMINQVSKVFDGRIATKMKNIYLKKDKQLNKQKEVLNKIKEEVEYWGYDRNTNDDSAFRMAMKKIHHLLEEIE